MAKPKTTGGPIHLCTLGAFNDTVNYLVPVNELPFWQDFLDVVFEATEEVPKGTVTWIIYDEEDAPKFKFFDRELSEQEVDDMMLEAGHMSYTFGSMTELKELSHSDYAELYSIMVADVKEP